MGGVIEQIEAVPISRRLRVAIRTAAGTVRELQGAEVRVRDEGGQIGVGEAPLLDESPTRAASLARGLKAASAKSIGRTPAEAREALAQGSELPAAGAWALDVALAQLQAGEGGLAAFLAEGRNVARVVRTNALLRSDEPAALEREAGRLADAGEHTLKLKVGLGRLSQDVDRTAAARAGAGAGIRLRLDANQAWDEAEAERRLAALASYAPEYVEQPVPASDLVALARLRRASSIPIAADEAARDPTAAARVLDSEAADVLVLKAPMLGAVAAIRLLVHRARDAGVGVVLSSLYDGSVSLWASVALAAALGLEGVHGLGTGPLLENPADAPVPRRGRIELPA